MNVSQEAAVKRPGPVMAFIRLGRFPYAIEAMLRGAVGALCYAYDHQQQVDVKRIFLTMTLILLVNSAVNYLNDWADYTGDLYHYTKSKESRTTGGSGILVRGYLPRYVALVAAVVFYAASIALVLVHRHLYPLDTPFQGNTLLGTLLSIFIATQYNGKPFEASYTMMCEFTSLSTVSVGSFLSGYNFQKHRHTEHFDVPSATFCIFFLDVLLQSSRILTMNITDIDGDLQVNKRTLAAIFGRTLSAKVYSILASLFCIISVIYAISLRDRLLSALVATTATIAIPQIYKVSQLLREYGKGNEESGASPPMRVSLLQMQTVLIWGSGLAWANWVR